jgi:DNA-binding MarR family transcriptional regulator
MAEKLLGRLLAVIEEFRKLDAEMPAQTIGTLLCVAVEPGISVSELAKRLNLKRSAASRNVAALSAQRSKSSASRKGYGLIAYKDDPDDSRRWTLHLTEKGEQFVAVIRKTMNA